MAYEQRGGRDPGGQDGGGGREGGFDGGYIRSRGRRKYLSLPSLAITGRTQLWRKCTQMDQSRHTNTMQTMGLLDIK